MVFWPFFGEKRDFQSSNHFFDLAGRDFLMILGKRSKNGPKNDHFSSKIMFLELDFGARFVIQKSQNLMIFLDPKKSQNLIRFYPIFWNIIEA